MSDALHMALCALGIHLKHEDDIDLWPLPMRLCGRCRRVFGRIWF